MVKKVKKVKELSDEKIVQAVRKGNKELFRELVKRYQKKLSIYLYHLVRNREETEDILQNVFIKVYDNLTKFNARKKFSSWIYRIAHNEAVNIIKRKNRKKFISWEDITIKGDTLDLKAKEKSPLDNWIEKELKGEMQEALGMLPEQYREVLILRYFLGKSYDEISEIIRKPVNTVGTLINRAKKRMLVIIKEQWK
jgi:RNA polymerase sigma-70 factor, ECF subfamily